MSIRIPYASFAHRGFERHFSVGMPLPWPLTVIWSCYITSVPEDYNVCFWMAPESFTGADYYGAAYGPGFAGGGLTQPWAISHSGVDTTTNSADVQTGRWYRQAFSAYQPGTGTKQLRYWYDLPVSNMISASPASNYYNSNGSTHRFRWGDSPWAPAEPLNGRIAWIKAWQGRLSDQEIFLESQYAWPVLNQHFGTLWGVWPLFGAAHFDSFAPGARKFHYNLDNSDKTLDTEGDPPLRFDRVIPRVRYFLPLTVLVSGAQNISPAGLASAEAFGAAQLNQQITGVGAIASAEAFGAALVNLQIAAAGAIASAEAFGTQQLNQQVAPAGLNSAEAFGTAVVSAEGIIIAPAGLASAEAFGGPLVAPGPVTVIAEGIASAEAFGTTTVLPGVRILSPAGLASAEAFGNAVLTGGAVGEDGLPTAPILCVLSEYFQRRGGHYAASRY